MWLIYLSILGLALQTRGVLGVEKDLSSKCLKCEALMETAYKTFTNEDTVATMIDKLDAQCSKLDDQSSIETCDKVVQALMTIPGEIFHGLEDMAWPVPQALCAFAHKCDAYCCDRTDRPEQVHLSLPTNDHSVMGVSWVTLTDKVKTVVQYGESEHDLSKEAEGSPSTYTYASWVGTIHRATMTDLAPGRTYYYRVGDGSHRWSKTFSFKTIPQDADRVNFAVIADMGYGENSDNTVATLKDLVDKGEIDVIIHSGDVGYADGYQPHWDVFMNKVEDIAARVPYMVSPGNHEFFGNFVAYKHRFFMPGEYGDSDGTAAGSGDGMFYSWECGPAHFVSLNSETRVDTGSFNSDMLDWAATDMAAMNRNATPWLIAHMHRPMYCSNDHDCDFTSAGHLRVQGERTLHNAGVDLAISGHVHAYERSTPVFGGKVMPAGRATTYIVQGASGNREGNKGSYPDDPSLIPEWSAARLTDIGYAIMTVERDSIAWRFYNSETRAVIDEVVLKK